MNRKFIDIMQDPYTGEGLGLENDTIINPITKKKYLNANGYYSFLQDDDLKGNNSKYGRFYDKIAWCYNLSNRIYMFFKFGGEGKARKEFLDRLPITDGHRVLEVSIGTGDNLPYLNPKAEYYGIDISKGMLNMAVKHVKRWNIPAHLFRCEGEFLPFKDNCFDVVFHHGGINYFNDQKRAIQEMVRVAKPGATILISDETEKLVKEVYQKNPLAAKLYGDASKAAAPVHLIPSQMEEVEIEVINKGLIYYMVFQKPRLSLSNLGSIFGKG